MNRKWMFALSVILVSLFALSGAFVIVMQSGFGREKITSMLLDALNDSGWKVSFGKTEGSILHEITLSDVAVESSEHDQIAIQTVRMQISLIHLLKKEIEFTEFFADGIEWKKGSEHTGSASNGIPYILHFSNLRLSHVHLPALENLAEISGEIKIGRFNRMAFAKLSTRLSDSTADLTLYVRPSKTTQLKLDLDAKTADLSPLSLPVSGHLNAHLYAKGPWSAFSDAFFQGGTDQKLRGFIRGQADIQEISGQDSMQAATGPWTFFSLIERSADQTIRLSNLTAQGSSISAKGQLAIDRKWQISESSLLFTIPDLSKLQIPALIGSAEIELQMTTPSQGTLIIDSPKFSWNDLAFEQTELSFHAEKEESHYLASLDLATSTLNQKWSGQCNLLWQDHSLEIFDLNLSSDWSQLVGNLTIDPNQLLTGELKVQTDNLHQFDIPLYGAVDATIRLKLNEKNQQNAEIDLKASELYYGDIQAGQAFLYANLSGSFSRPLGHAYAEIQNAHWKTLTISAASIETSNEDTQWPFTINMEGQWDQPLALRLSGDWMWANHLATFDLQEMTGSLFAHPLSLSAPAQIEIGSDHLKLPELSLSLGNSHLMANIDHNQEKTDASLKLQQFPLDVFSINPLSVSISGMVNLDANISQSESKTSGSVNAEIIQLMITSMGEETPIAAEGRITAEIKNERLTCESNLFVKNAPLLHLNADLPVSIRAFPFQIKPIWNERISADLALNGKIEELLDFFDLGPHRIEGDSTAHFNISQTLKKPSIKGSFQFTNGRYENYSSGFQLKNIAAEIVGNGHSLDLTSFTALDSQLKGRFSLKGALVALSREKYPFHFDGEFARLNVAEMPWMRAEAGGTIQIVGNLDSAHVTAQAAILESDISIPERLPHSLPKLDVKYINAPKPVAIQAAPAKRYPIFLDLHVFAPGGVFISGRGLSSEWKGNFDLGGTYTDVEAKGLLEMTSGEFLFSGRSFHLTEGTLTFSGRPHEMPQLNLAGRMQLQDLSILARLKGPLNAPELAFQSSPPLPMGSILSHLLFGQDLSDVNTLQAAQIVNSLATFSGDNSNVLASSRKSLGVDRLRIIATPIGPDGGQSIALQVGKYVTRGILVSVSQGPEGGSTNLSIEVDLTNGFVFQAESQQEQEQGKFSIKWNLNY